MTISAMPVGSRALHRPANPSVLALLLALALPGTQVLGQDAAPRMHRLVGTVQDSTSAGPLAGALVQLVSLDNRAWARSAISRADGGFVFDSLPPGAYALGYLHPRLDSLHLEPPLREVRVPGADSLALLAVPSVAAIARAACPDAPLADDEALFIGRLRPSREGVPASFGRVSVTWSETVIGGGVEQRRPAIIAETDGDGRFVICGVPAAAPTLVQGISERGETGVLELQAPASRLLLRDLFTAPIDRVWIAAPVDTGGSTDSTDRDAPVDSLALLRGPGWLRGAVLTADGTPISRARVRVRGSPAEALSDSLGRFELRGLPLGTHALEAIALGYAPLRQAADIAESDTARLVVTMSPADVTLDTVRVLGERVVPFWKREFDTRRKQGMGRFIDEAAIARRNPMLVTDMLAGLPGMTLRTGLFTSQSRLLMRTTGGYCAPNVIVNGMLVDVADIGIDGFVSATQLVGVEVYRSAILRPAEFPIQRKCGLIVLWTGVRQEQPR